MKTKNRINKGTYGAIPYPATSHSESMLGLNLGPSLDLEPLIQSE
jgi:hypothetical protein